MVLIAIDPHKSSHTACALAQGGSELGQLRVEAPQREQLLRWASRWPERRWAVEGAHGLGHGLAQWLVARGEPVVDVPARLVARVRLLSGDDKSDPKDARATALAALQVENLQPVLADDQPAVLRLLTDRRDDIAAERTRTVNRLHHLFRNLRPGGAPRKLSADEAARLLRGRRATAAPDRVRLQLARELVAELGVLDRKLRANEQQIEHSGPVDRYPTSGHYASYAGVAPLETSSGDVRQLNRALYIAAFTQSRMPATDGYAYVRRKRSEGKSRREALRCLKRRLADVVYRQLLADERAPRTAS